MQTIDEIFDSMPEAAADAGYEYLVIDPVTRQITVPEAERIFGVVSDEVAVRKRFLCPRYVGDGLDLAGMFLTVYFRNAQGEEDGYLVQDVQITGEYITFSWQLWPKVTKYNGPVQFAVCADLPNTATKHRPDWNTTLAEGEVLEGMDPDLGDLETGSSDVLTQLREMVAAQTAAVEATGAAQVAAVKAQGTNTTQEAVAAIQAQGEATVASIPADYTALAATMDRLTRDRAAAIVCQAEGTAIQVTDAGNDPLQGLRIFGRSTQDGTPTPEAPVEIVSTPAPQVTVCGKNLLPFPYKDSTVTKNGVTFTVQEDGAIRLKGTAEKATNFSVFSGSLPLHGTFTLSGVNNEVSPSTHYMQPYVDDVFQAAQIDGSQTYEIDGNLTALSLYVKNGETVDCIVRPQLEAGAVATGYETPTTQALTITTPGSLPGIPVASGGNYTDESGQQWIADEVDLARGVYVQRVEMITLTGAENWQEHASSRFYAPVKNVDTFTNQAILSTHFTYSRISTPGYYAAVGNRGAYLNKNDRFATVEELVAFLSGNSVIIIAELAKPVETPLSDVELQAFLAMHSNKPTTTVLNDAGAHMALEYAADPKTYIDNKLAALVAANG